MLRKLYSQLIQQYLFMNNNSFFWKTLPIKTKDETKNKIYIHKSQDKKWRI